jgi:fructose 1,6-bisphosphate aldolase/phosphatase
MPDKITLSVIKADVGGYVGHSASHDDLLEEARRRLGLAQQKGQLIDFHVTACGDDLELIMTHAQGVNAEEIHQLAWDVFQACTELARELKLYGAGQDLLADAFSGNIRGLGPGVAEMEFEERTSEPVIIFMADKTSAGAWNLPLYKMFADPFNTAGLIIAPSMHDGFRFEVHDVKGHQRIFFDCPEDAYDLLVFIGASGRYPRQGGVYQGRRNRRGLLHRTPGPDRRKIRRQGRPGLHRAQPGPVPRGGRSAGALYHAPHRGGLDAGLPFRAAAARAGAPGHALPV